MPQINQQFTNKNKLVLNITGQVDPTTTSQIVGKFQSQLFDAQALDSIEIHVESDDLAFVDALLTAIFSANLQSLKNISVHGMKTNWTPQDNSLITDNFFIQHISIPADSSLQSVFSATTARNRNAYAQQDGNAGVQMAWPPLLMIWLSLWVIGVTTSLSQSDIELLTPTGLVVVSTWLVASGCLSMLINAASRIARRHFEQGAQEDIEAPSIKKTVAVSLSVEQLARCNVILNAINQFGRSNIPLLPATTTIASLQLNKQDARLITALVQFARLNKVTAQTTYLTQQALQMALRIANSCGYSIDGKVGTLQVPFVKAMASASLVDSQPSRNRTPQQSMLKSKRGSDEQLGIVFLDAQVAAEAIRENQVCDATVNVNHDSLQQVAMACAGNTSLNALTLIFSNTVTLRDAENIAQIIQSNALRTLALQNAVFDNGAIELIESALLINGTLTSFIAPQVSAQVSTIIERNKAMRVPKKDWLIASGAAIGGAIPFFAWIVTAILGVFSSPRGILVDPEAISMLMMLIGPFFGAAIAALYSVNLQSNARVAAKQLQDAVLEQQQANPKPKVVPTGDQYAVAMQLLTVAQPSNSAVQTTAVRVNVAERPQSSHPQLKPFLAAQGGDKKTAIDTASAEYSQLEIAQSASPSLV